MTRANPPEKASSHGAASALGETGVTCSIGVETHVHRGQQHPLSQRRTDTTRQPAQPPPRPQAVAAKTTHAQPSQDVSNFDCVAHRDRHDNAYDPRPTVLYDKTPTSRSMTTRRSIATKDTTTRTTTHSLGMERKTTVCRRRAGQRLGQTLATLGFASHPGDFDVEANRPAGQHRHRIAISRTPLGGHAVHEGHNMPDMGNCAGKPRRWSLQWERSRQHSNEGQRGRHVHTCSR